MTKIIRRKPRLMLAYGSNLCQADMRRRAPDARPRGWIMIDNGRLVFRGVADVVPAIGYRVPVGIWEISPADEEKLDRYEGVASGYYDKEELKMPTGETALIYMMAHAGIYPPSQFYADTVRRGYRDFGLDERYLDAAIYHSLNHKDPSEANLARRERQRAVAHTQRIVRMTDDFAFRRLEAAARKRRVAYAGD